MRVPCVAAVPAATAVLIAAVAAASGAMADTAGPAPPADTADPALRAGQVVPGYPFRFPRDHFGHPEFESEWWYYTGNLFTASGRHFGFELTFFRRGAQNLARENRCGATLGLGSRPGVSRALHDHRHRRRTLRRR